MMSLISEVLVFTFHFIVICIKCTFSFIYKAVFPKRKDVSGDVVVVTGAGSGLGQLMCIKFSRLGSIVVGWDINEAGLETTKSLVREQTGKDIHTYVCDVSKPEAVYEVAKRTRQDVDAPISIFVNNAGIVAGKLLTELSDALIDKVFKVNTLSHFWTTKAVLPEMMEKKKGHLVFIASSAGWFGGRRLTEYCASKAADILFAESLTAELHFGGYPEIKITTVCPWLINTGMFAGCECNFPNLVPNQAPEATVDKIVDAVLREQAIVAMPRIVYFMNFMKSFLPTDVHLSLLKKVGSDTLMDTFEGRSAKL